MFFPGVAAMSPWWVVCLCAEWCGVCREYRSSFDAVARLHPGVRFAWIDVEDDDDLVGDLDVETFPTVLIAGEGQARFLAPVLPHADLLPRLLESLQKAAPTEVAPDAQAQALFDRLRARDA